MIDSTVAEFSVLQSTITGLLWAVLIIASTIAGLVCFDALWRAAWHSDPKFADVDSLAEHREETNRRLAAEPTWRPEQP